MIVQRWEPMTRFSKRVIGIFAFDYQAIIASALRPPLTSLQLPHYDMGRWGVNFLLNTQQPTDKQVQALHHCQLVLRQSV